MICTQTYNGVMIVVNNSLSLAQPDILGCGDSDRLASETSAGVDKGDSVSGLTVSYPTWKNLTQCIGVQKSYSMYWSAEGSGETIGGKHGATFTINN